MKAENAAFGFVILWFALVLAILAGWAINIVALVNLDWDHSVTVEAVLRCLGIVVVPLGAIMGYFV